MKIPEALSQWIERKCRSLSPAYGKLLRHWVFVWEDVFGKSKEVEEVSVSDVERLEATRDDGERSASALNQECVYLRAFFVWAKALGYCSADPTVTWRYRRPVVKRTYATLTREEEDRLVEVAESWPWLQTYVRVAVCTGLREGTVRQLTWAMLRPDGVLEIPAKIMKSRHAHRIPLPERALAALGPRGPGVLIKALPSKTRVWQVFKAACKKAGISEAASPHDLRRSWVERLSTAGVPLQTIQSLGAWKTASVLLNHYCPTVSTDRAREILAVV